MQTPSSPPPLPDSLSEFTNLVPCCFYDRDLLPRFICFPNCSHVICVACCKVLDYTGKSLIDSAKCISSHFRRCATDSIVPSFELIGPFLQSSRTDFSKRSSFIMWRQFMETWDILQPLKAKCKINKEAIMCLNCLCIKKNGLENCCSRSPQFTVSSYRPDCHGSAEFAVADTEDLLTITEHVRLLKLSHQPAAPQSTISSSILSPSFTPRKSPGALFATPQSSTSAPPITPSSSGLSTSLLSPYPVVPYSVVPTLSSHEFQTPIQATNREITSLSSPVSEESLEKKFIYCVGEQYLDPDRRSFGRIEAIPIQNLDAYDLGENNSSRIKRAKNAHGKLELLLFNNSRISEHIKSRLG